MTHSSVPLHDLPALPRDAEGPVFNEPWEAHAFALAVRLSEAGFFSWPEWTAFLTEAIRAARQQGDPDSGQTYYHHWLAALERLCIEKSLVRDADMQRRKEEWRRAYLHTPHGQPIELSAGQSDAR
ncbi:MAG TPA: nitrile hydratase accessory protein [Gemmataceae bacterium]|nr:nitrile hydratase accessory protein [Gemmataceae bacterium]